MKNNIEDLKNMSNSIFNINLLNDYYKKTWHIFHISYFEELYQLPNIINNYYYE